MESNLHARPYQVEILQKAKKENTIVCLGTGTGKTFISVMLIGEKLHETKKTYENGGKRTFFLVNTVPLAEQQKNVIEKNLSLKVKFFTGEMGVDFWDGERWIREFDANQVLVMTSQILLNILNCGMINLGDINLLIFDECHNATKKHPYVRIMELFVVAEKKGLQLPHIMGLTASIINENYKSNIGEIKFYLDKKMKNLEGVLKSKCITCSDPEATTKFAPKPVETVESYSQENNLNSQNDVEIISVITSATEYFGIATKEYAAKKKERKENRNKSDQIDYEEFVQRTSILGFKDGCSITLDAINYCSHILETLGPLCTNEAACILKENIEKHMRRFKDKDRETLEDCDKVLDRFVTSYKGCLENTSDCPMKEPFITKKAMKFLNILSSEKKRFKEDYDADLHAIVFVQRRCTAVILNKLINYAAKTNDAHKGLSSKYVLGHGLDENIKLADSFMKSSQQNTVLKEFKDGVFNVLVSTSVVEEGLDVRKCNLVIRFDGIVNYREYAQSKGRARAEHSKFIVMAEDSKKNEMEGQMMVMQNIEKILFENCQNRQAPTKEESDRILHDSITEVIPTIVSGDGNARIPHHCSVALLYRFCSYLPHDIYTNTSPMFTFETKPSMEGFAECQAECVLPFNFPLEQRVYKSDWMGAAGEKQAIELAKKELASRICGKLHLSGHLTEDHLLPRRNKDERRKRRKKKKHTQDGIVEEESEDVSSSSSEDDEDTDSEELLTEDSLDSSEDDEVQKKYALHDDVTEVNNSVKPDEGNDSQTDDNVDVTLSSLYEKIGNKELKEKKHKKFYQRKVPDVLSKNFNLDDCNLYAISIVLSDLSVKHKALRPLWCNEYKEGFGILLSKEVTELPSFKLYRKIGEFTVSFVKLSNNKLQLSDKVLIESYHGHVCNKFFKPYIYKDLQIASDDTCDDIAKGFIIPLKPIVFSYIQNNQVPVGCENPIDFGAINEALNFSEVNGSKTVSVSDQVVVRKTYLHESHQQYNIKYCVIGPSKETAGDIMDKTQSYVSYYKEKHDLTVDPNTQLIDVVQSRPKSFKYVNNSKTKRVEAAKAEGESEAESEAAKAEGESEAESEAAKAEGDYYRRETRCDRLEKLVPGLCEKADGMSSQHHEQARMLPYIFYELEILLNSEELTNILTNKIDKAQQMKFDSLPKNLLEAEATYSCNGLLAMREMLRPECSPTTISKEILKATTTKQAAFGVDLERLEMLGDSFLKLAVSTYSCIKYPRMDEGKLTEYRQNSVRNKRLCQIAKILGINGYINNSAFGKVSSEGENKNPITVWLPPSCCRINAGRTKHLDNEVMVNNVDPEILCKSFQHVRNKTLADSVEALIGVYFKVGGVNRALRFVSDVLKIPCLFKDIREQSGCKVQQNTSSIYGDFPKPSTAEYNENVSFIASIEELYEKKNLSVLEENIGYTFQDKSHIVRAMTHPSYNDNKVTRAYQEYEYLGDAILDFLITTHIYSCNEEFSPGQLTDVKMALVNNNIFSFFTIQLNLYKHVFHMSPLLMRDCRQFIDTVAELTTEDCFKNPFIVASDSGEGLMAPKVMGDLVESLAGAIFLDSGLDLMKVWEVFFPIMKPIIEKYMKEIPLMPKRQLHETYKTVEFQFPAENEIDTNDCIECIVYYGNGKAIKKESGCGKSKRIAMMMACYRALKKEGDSHKKEKKADKRKKYHRMKKMKYPQK